MLSISIHALREEGDNFLSATGAHRGGFLSTPSARRATLAVVCDCKRLSNFYPRPPRGGRRGRPNIIIFGAKFLSTPSARRATTSKLPSTYTECQFLSTPSARRATAMSFHSATPTITFLSTPSARRATCRSASLWSMSDHFYPRPPRGGRRGSTKWASKFSNFYPRPPRGGRLIAAWSMLNVSPDFYPRPPRGGRPLPFRAYAMIWQISIHALREEGDVSGHPDKRHDGNFYPRPP